VIIYYVYNNNRKKTMGIFLSATVSRRSWQNLDISPKVLVLALSHLWQLELTSIKPLVTVLQI
jgi:hypothetical protein